METHTSQKAENSSLNIGSMLIALAGAALVGYGFVILIRNISGSTEPGLTAEQLGAAPAEIQAFSQDIYNYILHIQAANAGFIIGLGIAVIALAMFGIRRGQSWSLWTALLATLVALAIALPLHYPFGFDTLGHLGPIYLVIVILVVGTFLCWRALST